MHRRRLLCALAAGATGALAGCGGDGSDGSDAADRTPTEADGTDPATTTASGDGETDPTPTATRSTETPETTEPTRETTDPTPTATPTATPTPVAQVVAVGEGGFNFAPETFEIAAGETVRWEWRSSFHNVVPESTPDGSDWSGTTETSGYTYEKGYTHSHTFETPGEYSYYCDPHRSSGMTGSFTVTE